VLPPQVTTEFPKISPDAPALFIWTVGAEIVQADSSDFELVAALPRMSLIVTVALELTGIVS
jgi:hypothetical protein